MLKLLNKELKLSINIFFFIMPLVLGLLFFIPGWIYMLVFMYFFWISIPQIFSAYVNQKDYDFLSMLPVSKENVVKSKVYAIFIIEGLHVLFAIIFGLIHNQIYGPINWIFFDINLAFFGIAILMYGVFNITFLPAYFKTAYFFGKPLIVSSVVTFIYAFIFEFGVARYEFMRNIFEGNMTNQTIVFVAAIVLTVLLCFITIKKSIKNYVNI